MSLRDKTIRGISWNVVNSILTTGLQFIIGILLARLLTPTAYGLIGMIGIFIAIAQALMDSGIGAALIRKTECSQEMYSTAFYFKISVSIILYGIAFFSAPAISQFFNEPQLVIVARVICLNFIVQAISSIHRTILIRSIDFKSLMHIRITSLVVSGSIGITMAYFGYGVWSLVFQNLIHAIIGSVLLWRNSQWRPSLTFNYAIFKDLFSFGSKLLLARLINTLHNNIYNIIIGKYFSVEQLGLYSKAKKLSMMFGMNAFSAIQSVTYPVLSSIGDETERLQRNYKRILMTSTMIVGFLLMNLAATADSLINGLLGPSWAPSVPYLQLLCFSQMLYPLQALNLNILKVKGRSDLFLKLSILIKLLIVPEILVGIYYGIIPMLFIVALSSIIAYFINSYYSKQLVSYSTSEQLKDVAPSYLLSLVIAVPVYFIGYLLKYPSIVELVLQSCAIVLGGFLLGLKSQYTGIVELRDIITLHLKSFFTGR